MKFFATLGKHPQLSLMELQIINPQNIEHYWYSIVVFDIEESDNNNESDYTNTLNNLSWISKRWKIINLEEIDLEGKTVWTNDDDFGMELKKKYWAKRYKFVETIKSDLEIKNEWIEILKIKEWIYGQVLGYQNIWFYETVDFGKPSHGMQVGMMPTKLAMTMVNIWLRNFWKKKLSDFTIYDPFCGFGTTGFITNYMWYNFVWSDINISMIKPNKKRRMEDPKTQAYRQDKFFTIFKHDATVQFEWAAKNADLIVTEWRLWPVTGLQTHIIEIRKNAQSALEVYMWFIQNCHQSYKNITIVMTYPVYRRSDYEDIIWPSLISRMADNWRKHEMIDLYSRADHTVARQVIVCIK